MAKVHQLNMNNIRGHKPSNAHIIAIGGGKGGVGKSFISSNIGIFLANMGFKTVLIDLDLGAPNLHTSLGEKYPPVNFHQFLDGKVDHLDNVATATQFPNLRLITGSNDNTVNANINTENKSKLMSSIYNLDADFVVLDLSAGTHEATLDFFNMAHEHILVVSPEPSSIENAYRFMKAVFFRKIKRFDKQYKIDHLITDLMDDPNKYDIRFPTDMLVKLKEIAPEETNLLLQQLLKLHFKVIINQVRLKKDIELGTSIAGVSKKYFGTHCSYAGYIAHDNAVWQALRKRRPLLLEYPHSQIYAQILGLTRNIAKNKKLKSAV